MKLTESGENALEQLALAVGLVPVPLLHTHLAFIRARAVMVAVRLDVFEALAPGPLTAAEVAARCGTSAEPTARLLDALAACGYVACRRDGYALSTLARRWLVGEGAGSLRDKVLFEFLEWEMVARLDEFVRSGVPLDIHAQASDEQWRAYQRAMRALAGLAAPEIVRRTPVPRGATAMLDLGGSHGFISVALCRRHAGLRAVVLDLPEAIAHAAPILAREQMGERVVHREGDVRTEDLGEQQWDLVHASQLLHHFDAETNRALVARVARALKPGGVFVVLELVRGTERGRGQVGALLDLYFALTSRSGTWSCEEIAGWQREAGLVPRRPIRLRTVPGAVELVAVKR